MGKYYGNVILFIVMEELWVNRWIIGEMDLFICMLLYIKRRDKEKLVYKLSDLLLLYPIGFRMKYHLGLCTVLFFYSYRFNVGLDKFIIVWIEEVGKVVILF